MYCIKIYLLCDFFFFFHSLDRQWIQSWIIISDYTGENGVIFFCDVLWWVSPSLLRTVGGSLAWEWATTIDKHCTHSSAFFPPFGFKIKDCEPVKISKAFGIFRAPRDTFTERIWFTDIGRTSFEFWNNNNNNLSI